MKTIPLFFVLFLATASVAMAQYPEATAVALKRGQRPPSPTIHSYQDVLAQIPPGLRTTKPRGWTRLQREQVNVALKESLIDSETPAKLVLKVVDIADWGGWTFYANIPSQEGYPIRVFGKFTDDWKERFSTLKRGDTVVLQGVLSGATYRDLWNKFTLSIGLKNCTFTKVAASDEPNVAL